MVTSGRLRFLLLDDRPSIVDTLTNCPSFVTGCGPNDREIFERNFELSWLYSRAQLKEYYYRQALALEHAPHELTEQHAYPSIVLFDYAFDKETLTELTLTESDRSTKAYAAINPLNGEWGRHFEKLPIDQSSFSERLGWKLPNAGSENYDGCIAGALIAKQLSDFASVCIPQTVHERPKTEFLEWMLDIELQDAFDLKTGRLVYWQVFFSKALPRLRTKILHRVRTGTLTPNLEDLVAISSTLSGTSCALADRELRLFSRLGIERIRVEALFLDKFYQLSMSDGSLHPLPAEQTNAAISEWLESMLVACAGSCSRTDIRLAIERADMFIGAYAHQRHEERRILSSELARANGDVVKATEVVHTRGPLLRTLGVDTNALIEACRVGDVQKVSCVPTGAELQYLDTLPNYAQGHAARYLAIALAVWTEMTVRGLGEKRLRERIDRLLHKIEDPDSLAADLLAELQEFSGMMIPPNLVDEVRRRRGTSDDQKRAKQLIQERLGYLETLLGFGYLYNVEGEEHEANGWSFVAGSENEILKVMQDVMAPAPMRLLLWRDMEEKRGDVEAPLKRLKLKTGEDIGLSLRHLVTSRHRADGGLGLFPGEGRLIALFATHYGYPQRYWAPWMRDGVHQ